MRPFFDLLDVPYFPPLTDIVLRLVGPSGCMSAIWKKHSGRSDILRNGDPTAVTGAAKGLAHAMDMSLKFDNYMNLALPR